MYHRLHKILENELEAVENKHVDSVLDQAVAGEVFPEIGSETTEISPPTILAPVAPAP